MAVSRGECGNLPWFRPWFHLVPLGFTARAWRFRAGSAGICLGSALGSTWFHLVSRPAHGGFARGVREFALVPPLVPPGSTWFHGPRMAVSRGECGNLPWFRPWFHLVPLGFTARAWRF